VSQLTAAQLDALRTLRAAYPDAEIAIIGATALAFHIDMTWRTSVDLDLVIAVSAADLARPDCRDGIAIRNSNTAGRPTRVFSSTWCPRHAKRSMPASSSGQRAVTA